MLAQVYAQDKCCASVLCITLVASTRKAIILLHQQARTGDSWVWFLNAVLALGQRSWTFACCIWQPETGGGGSQQVAVQGLLRARGGGGHN